MLNIILQALNDLLQTQNRTLTVKDRINLYKAIAGKNQFTRKNYLNHFKKIAQATASRDLKWAVEQKILVKFGENRLTKYRFKV